MWNTTFRQVYQDRYDSLEGIPWHGVLGNHDWGNGETGGGHIVQYIHPTAT